MSGDVTTQPATAPRNASESENLAQLREGLATCGIAVELRQNPTNFGFTGVSNSAFRKLLQDAGVQRVLTRTNDAVARSALREWLAHRTHFVDPHPRVRPPWHTDAHP